ncbi:hypothetical protein V6N13_068701 [Hibiscus sabdariffa]|uniref:Uncharacterized protein n=1 Tax=Hibiscus sabdariffa TaxID=183260 RepID=A0ABR2QNN3_9ROSI
MTQIALYEMIDVNVFDAMIFYESRGYSNTFSMGFFQLPLPRTVTLKDSDLVKVKKLNIILSVFRIWIRICEVDVANIMQSGSDLVKMELKHYANCVWDSDSESVKFM